MPLYYPFRSWFQFIAVTITVIGVLVLWGWLIIGAISDADL